MIKGAVNLHTGQDTRWFGVDIKSSLHGVLTVPSSPVPGDQPAPAGIPVLSGHKFYGCNISYHERSGVLAADLSDSGFYGCTISNNGQSSTFGQSRFGLAVTASISMAGVTTVPDYTMNGIVHKGSPKTGLVFDTITDDTQGFTAPGFLDPTTPTRVAVDRPEKYCAGQTITITGAGSPDVKTRVNDVIQDELVLENPVTTFPEVALTGTVAVTGKSVTGVGTKFLTELTGRGFIKVAGQTLRVGKVADDTHATVDVAATVAIPAGSAAKIVKANIVTTHSQTYGFEFSADTVSPIMLTDRQPAGNVTAAVKDLSVPAVKWAGLKVPVPAKANDPGKPGDWAADSGAIYAYTGNGTTHTWVKSVAATW
jgi:hypothetical protein